MIYSLEYECLEATTRTSLLRGYLWLEAVGVPIITHVIRITNEKHFISCQQERRSVSEFIFFLSAVLSTLLHCYPYPDYLHHYDASNTRILVIRIRIILLLTSTLTVQSQLATAVRLRHFSRAAHFSRFAVKVR